MIDRDEDATDPLVNAQELLPRMKLLSCRIPPLRRQRRKAIKMVKSVGEGDWGGKGDLEKPEVRTHPSYTNWLLDFVGAGPPLVSGGLDDDNATQWESLDQGPQPGPSTRPTSDERSPSCSQSQRRGGAAPDTTRGRYKPGEGHGCLSLGPATDGARPPTKHCSGKFRATFPSCCPKGTTYYNLTTNSMPTSHQPTSPAKRCGNRERETSIQSDQVSEMGEVSVGFQLSQQQGERGANDRGRHSNAVNTHYNSWEQRQQPQRFPSTSTPAPTPRKRWNNLPTPPKRWNNLWTPPKTWSEGSTHIPYWPVDRPLHYHLHHQRDPGHRDTGVWSDASVHRLRLRTTFVCGSSPTTQPLPRPQDRRQH